MSLHFVTYVGTPRLSVNGETIPVIGGACSGCGAYPAAADISRFGGQTVTLTFLADRTSGLAGIDDITFSTVPVPEPSGIALLAVGLVGAAFAKKRKHWKA
jgi:hypothetical protein